MQFAVRRVPVTTVAFAAVAAVVAAGTITFTSPPAAAADVNLTQFVDPMLGTAGIGSTSPAAQVPFGGVQWGPDTGKRDLNRGGVSYNYSATTINGFSVSHVNGAGCDALRDLPFMPTVGDPNSVANRADISFDRTTERASAGSYSVTLGNGVAVDLTATTRTGHGRFSFPATAGRRNIVLDAAQNSQDRRVYGNVGQGAITGWVEGKGFCFNMRRQRTYFAVKFDQDIKSEINDFNGRLILEFTAPVVQAKVSLSSVSAENALRNITAENPGFNFEATKAAADDNWNKRLNSIQITAAADQAAQRRTFYTALYRSMSHPNVFSDTDGKYRDFAGVVQSTGGNWVNYATFSLWDTYRSQAQLLGMVAPDVAQDLIRSLVDVSRVCGILPLWTLRNNETNIMLGSPGIPTIAGMAAFGGLQDPAVRTQALAAMKQTVNAPDNQQCAGRSVAKGYGNYVSRGYSAIGDETLWEFYIKPPSTTDPDYQAKLAKWRGWGWTALTMEYAISDFAYAQFARASGDTAEYNRYLPRSQNWENVFNPATKYPSARTAGGEFQQNSTPGTTPSPTSQFGFAEGNATQYTFMVPHDMHTLVSRLGGRTAAAARLDSLFNTTDYTQGYAVPTIDMGNEPAFNQPWAYVWAGKPSGAQRVASIARRTLFNSTRGSSGNLPGDDDLGATSAWYVFAALGIYPSVYGTSYLAFNSPMFPKAVIKGVGATTLSITNKTTAGVDANGDTNPYVQSLRVNGAPSQRAWIRYGGILQQNTTLDFVVGGAATTWGSAVADAPPDELAGI